MTIDTLIASIQSGTPVSFSETIEVIKTHYQYTPSRFTNGIGAQAIVNEAGTNEGSCRIFAFALLQGLSEPETLQLFGDFYRKDVLENPEGQDHLNIRTFMRDGWAGIQFDQPALSAL
jgi:hypothetical protein